VTVTLRFAWHIMSCLSHNENSIKIAPNKTNEQTRCMVAYSGIKLEDMVFGHRR